MPGNLSGRTDGRTDGRTCRKTVTVGRVDQRTYVQVKRGYFRLRTDGRTDGQPENIMPPAPKGGGITIDIHCQPIYWNIFSLERDFCFSYCKMDCIGCNWFETYGPGFCKWTEWVPLRNCPVNTFMQLWMSRSLQVKVVDQLMGWTGIDSVESHRLKRPSGLEFVKFRQCRAIFTVKYCHSLLDSLVKGADRLILLWLWVSYKVSLARYCGCRRLDLLMRGLMATAKGFPQPRKTDICWGWCLLIGFSQVPGEEPVNSSHRTSLTLGKSHLPEQFFPGPR